MSLIEGCGAALRRLAGLAKAEDCHWLELDLSMGQFKAMFLLTMQGAKSVGALGRLLDIGEPAASLLVDKLEERGLARREHDPTDRRRTFVVPTEEGRQRILRLRQMRDERLADWLRQLSDEELGALSLGLDALNRVAEASMGSSQLERVSL